MVSQNQAVFSGRYTESGQKIYVSAGQKAREDRENKKTSKNIDISPALSQEAQARQRELQEGKFKVSDTISREQKKSGSSKASTTPTPSFYQEKGKEQSNQFVKGGITKVATTQKSQVNRLPQSGNYFGANPNQVKSVVKEEEKIFPSFLQSTKRVKDKVTKPIKKVVSAPSKSPLGKAITEAAKEELTSPSTAAFATFAAIEPTVLGEIGLGVKVASGVVKGVRLGKTITGGVSASQVIGETSRKTEEYSAPLDIQEFRKNEKDYKKSVEEARKSLLVITSPERQQKRNKLIDTPFPESIPFVGGLSLRQQGTEIPLVNLRSKGNIKELEKETTKRLIEEGYNEKEAKKIAKSGSRALLFEARSDPLQAVTQELSGNVALRSLLRPVKTGSTVAIETLSKGQFFTRNIGRTAVASIGETAPAIAAQETRVGGEMSTGEKLLTGGFGAATSSVINAGIYKGVTSNNKALANFALITGNVLDPAEAPVDLLDTGITKLRKGKEIAFVTNINKQGDIATLELSPNEKVKVEKGGLRIISGQTPTDTVLSLNKATEKNNNENIKNFDDLIKSVERNKATKPRGGETLSFDSLISSDTQRVPESDRTPISEETPISTPQSTPISNVNNNLNNLNNQFNNNINIQSSNIIPISTPIKQSQTFKIPTVINTGSILPPIPLALPNTGRGVGVGSGKGGRKTFANELAISLRQLQKGFSLGGNFIKGEPLKKKTKKKKSKRRKK